MSKELLADDEYQPLDWVTDKTLVKSSLHKSSDGLQAFSKTLSKLDLEGRDRDSSRSIFTSGEIVSVSRSTSNSPRVFPVVGPLVKSRTGRVRIFLSVC